MLIIARAETVSEAHQRERTLIQVYLSQHAQLLNVEAEIPGRC
jgi:hypothetical protein